MSQRSRWPLSLFVIVLALVGLACNIGETEDADKPSVVINSPADGADITIGEEVEIVSTSFSKNGIARVELGINGQAFSADELADNPEAHIANIVWTPLVEGAAVISVVTYDVQGSASELARITVQVVKPGESPPDKPPSPTDTEVPPTKTATPTKTKPPTPTVTVTPFPEVTFHPIEIPKFPFGLLSSDIVGIDITWNNNQTEDIVEVWYANGQFSQGSIRDLDEFNAIGDCLDYGICPCGTLPPEKLYTEIIDVTHVLANSLIYYRDGVVKVIGGPDCESRLNAEPEDYSLPPGKTPEDIVGIASTCANLHQLADVYAWYKNGTVSSGTYLDLDSKRTLYDYNLPPGKKTEDIVGIGIACSDDHVYVWYNDGTVSSGSSRDLDKYLAPQPYTKP